MRQHYDTQIYVTVEIYTGLAICKVSGVNLSLNLVKKKSGFNICLEIKHVFW